MARPCLGFRGEPPCPELVEPPRSRCPDHARAQNAAKAAQPHRWVYADPRWRACRERAGWRVGWRCQAIENGERCETCGLGLHGHHAPLTVVELLELGLDPFDERRVVMLCDRHHGQAEAELRADRSARER